jgi:two-component system, OmpR family, response regulator MtrA
LARVLIAEDEPRLAAFLEKGLRSSGFTTTVVHDGLRAAAAADESDFDLMVLDLGLPGKDGLEVLRELRASGSQLPVIVLTARDDTSDRVAGLEAGADDYVTKPVVIKELAARIRALLRRVQLQESAPPKPMVFGDIEIRREQGVVLKAGEPLALTKTEFLLLCEFAEHADMVLSRDQLLERVWGYDYLGDSRLVDAHVRRLRVKVEAQPEEPTLILTVRGIGYRLHVPGT